MNWPVYNALLRYFEARNQDGNALADTHQHTSNALRQSAGNFQSLDLHNGRQIRQAEYDTETHRRPDTPALGSSNTSTPTTPVERHPSSNALPGPEHQQSNAPGTAATNADAPPMPVPFAAASGTDKEKTASPATAEQPNVDLMLARVLLSVVLDSVPDAAGPDWAVTVMRDDERIWAFVTSNEGRGWLPEGVRLPTGVSLPWAAEFTDELHGADLGWEELSDPAQVLVEFGEAWGRNHGCRISALVASGPVPDAVRARIPAAAVEGGFTGGLDLTGWNISVVDRLDAGGSADMLAQVSAVPDNGIRRRLIELAGDAHRHLGAEPSGAGNVRRCRERILNNLMVGTAVPASWWEELRNADRALAAGSAERRLGFERRADELVLALAEEPTRQQLRDACYTHAQIIDHPLFDSTAAAAAPERGVSIPADLVTPAPRDDSDAITTGGSTAASELRRNGLA